MSTENLFDAPSPAAPLAERLRPKHIDEVIGQSHLLGEGRPLRLAFQSGKLHSMILWGPPGVGKTTLARLMAQAFDAEFVPLSAVLSGVKDIREAIAQAQQVLQQRGRHTILFVDEVHRFNKSQQDAFLPFVEQGLVTFIGATTENPSFEVNNALLSRAQVYVLHALSAEELGTLFERARHTALADLQFNDDARERIIGYADGDARRLLNALEQLQTAAQTSGVSNIDTHGQHAGAKPAPLTRRRGVLRPDFRIDSRCKAQLDAAPASFMLAGLTGAIWRGASCAWRKDIGPPIRVRSSTQMPQTYERLGSPEGELALAQAVLYMPAPKSNAGYVAYNAARPGGERYRAKCRCTCAMPTKLMKQLDYGKDYHAHDEEGGYAAGKIFPDDMPEVSFTSRPSAA